jgi:hypothetical protein
MMAVILIVRTKKTDAKANQQSKQSPPSTGILFTQSTKATWALLFGAMLGLTASDTSRHGFDGCLKVRGGGPDINGMVIMLNISPNWTPRPMMNLSMKRTAFCNELVASLRSGGTPTHSPTDTGTSITEAAQASLITLQPDFQSSHH